MSRVGIQTGTLRTATHHERTRGRRYAPASRGRDSTHIEQHSHSKTHGHHFGTQGRCSWKYLDEHDAGAGEVGELLWEVLPKRPHHRFGSVFTFEQEGAVAHPALVALRAIPPLNQRVPTMLMTQELTLRAFARVVPL